MGTLSDTSGSPTRAAMSAGAVTAALMFVAPMLPLLNFIPQTTCLIAFFGGIFFAMRRLVQRSNADVRYSAKVVQGFKTAFFASLILAFVVYFLAKIEPAIIRIYLDNTEKMLQSSDFPPGIVSAQMQQLREMIGPGMLAGAAMMTFCLVGAVAACICAPFCGLFLKKNETTNVG